MLASGRGCVKTPEYKFRTCSLAKSDSVRVSETTSVRDRIRFGARFRTDFNLFRVFTQRWHRGVDHLSDLGWS